MRGLAYRGSEVSFGDFALQATQCGRMTARQMRLLVLHDSLHQASGISLLFQTSPFQSLRTMGKGKSGPDHWVAIIKPGRVLYEIQGVEEEIAKEAFRLAGHKLPFKTKFIKRREVL